MPPAQSAQVLALTLALVTSLWGWSPVAAGAAPGDKAGTSATQVADADGASVTPAILESKLKEVSSSTDLDDATKAKLTEQYRKALAGLEAEKASQSKSAAFAKALDEAPAETARLRALPEGPPRAEPIPTDADLRTLEQLLAKQTADATNEEARLANIEKNLDASTGRPAEARARLVEVKRLIETTEADLATAPEAGASDLAQARRWALQAARGALIAEQRMLEQELASLDVRTDLLRARRDRSILDLKAIKARQQVLEAAVAERRRAGVEQVKAEADAAEVAAQGKDPRVLEHARANSELGEALKVLTAAQDRLERRRNELQVEIKRIEDDYRNARERLDVAGSRAVLGPVLGDQRRALPDPRGELKAVAERERHIADTALAEIQYREDLRRLQDREAYLDQALAGLAEPDRARVRAELAPLIEGRASLLEQMQTGSNTLLRGLIELNALSAQLVDTVGAYDDYLAQRLLWVRSVLPINRASLAGLPGAIDWFVFNPGWREVVATLRYQAEHSVLFWLEMLFILGLLAAKPLLLRAIRATAEPLRRVRTDRFAYTLKAIALSALVASPISLLLVLVGMQLAGSVQGTTFAKNVGLALVSMAVMVYNLRSFRILCISGGVADKHFRWPADVLARLRRTFGWALYLLLPAGFMAELIYLSDEPGLSGSLGRMSVLLISLAIAGVFGYLLHPATGALKHVLAEHPQGWANRLRYLWYPLAVGTPLALAVLAVTGYLFAAGTLLRSIVHTLWLALALIVAHQAISRWLLVTRRSLALTAALERAAARKAEPSKVPAEDGELRTVVEEPVVDLASLDQQTRTLVGALVVAAGLIGLWGVWSEVLPAFSFLNRFQLWSHPGLVGGEERLVPVTLADLLLVGVSLVAAAVAVRNLPALLEILLLQYTKVSAGGRYTLTTLTGYVITAVAILYVLSTLGVNWSKLQWLVAALGVGIGFGLQEIVANFISGLIILFERPVRVGDVITIAGTTGTVTRIQIRATTIRNYDQQELLVPNKQFITGELLNWSLSDQINRVIITVGVDYGSDTHKAMALLAEVARENPRVLKDPAPLIAFEGFGDNALTLSLRCYLGSVDGRLGVTTELHQAIYDKLSAAGIGFAYPQRDVHLTASRPLDIRLHRRPPPATPAG